MKDEAFTRGNVPMTKEEVRTICIAKLDLEKDAVLYDVGAGTGSVAVEAACQDGSIRVYAIEKNPEGIELIRKKRAKNCGQIMCRSWREQHRKHSGNWNRRPMYLSGEAAEI